MKELEHAWCPAIEFNETETNLILKAELPGVEIKHLNIHAEPESISISGNRSHQKLLNENEKELIPSQLHYGRLNCNIDLPAKIQVDRVQAELTNGVLTLTMPKIVVVSTSVK